MFKAGSRQLITNALAAGGPQPAKAALPPVIFPVTVSFKQQQATVRLALPGEDYTGKPLEALLPQLELLSTQHISGAYKIVGVAHDHGGARLDVKKSLRCRVARLLDHQSYYGVYSSSGRGPYGARERAPSGACG